MILIILLLLLLFLFYKKLLSPKIIFYSKQELSYFLSKDIDCYYKQLNIQDLKLRKINNIYDYLFNIENNLYTFTKYDKKIIKQAIYKANKQLKNIKYPGLNNKKIYSIPWCIGGIYNNNYEFGLPHTRSHIILINKNNIYDKDLYKLLIHEKIHIYQKKYPNEINKFLKYFNFIKYRLKSNIDRSNPDLDNYIYKQKNKIYQCNINNLNVTCTDNSYKYEHPFEFMAYDIVDKIN